MSDRPPGSSRGAPSGSQAGSKSGSKAGSQAGSSKSGAPSKSSGKAPEAQKVDPALMRKPLTDTQILGKRFDLPPDAYISGKGDTHWEARPAYCAVGKPIKIGLNIFPVISYGDRDIYQYDVIVTPNLKNSHSLVKKVWNTSTVKDHLHNQGGKWLYDGSKLAWSSEKLQRGEARLNVDLDILKKKADHEQIKKRLEKNSVYQLIIRQTKVIRLSYLKNYLAGKIPWDTHVLECMNFFDHCLRQTPSERWLLIKRNFFDPHNGCWTMLSNDLIAGQGIYLAPRLSEAFNRGGTGLAINVDRCQTAFWPHTTLLNIACYIVNGAKPEWQGLDNNGCEAKLRPAVKRNVNTNRDEITQSEAFMFLRRMTKLRFTVSHRGKLGEPREYTVKRIMFDVKYEYGGANAKNVTFMKKFEDGHVEETTIEKHYKDRWGTILRWPRFPIVETPQGHMFPMEICDIVPNQRYNFKLNPRQTSDMIKRAATRPPKRRDDIMEGVKAIDWQNDESLKAFGIKIDPRMTFTDAKLLDYPGVLFGTGELDPKYDGRWDLRGRKFLEPNTKELTSWSFIGLGTNNECVRMNELENFASKFTSAYKGHGGIVKRAPFCKIIPYTTSNVGKMVEAAYAETRNFFKGTHPQIIFFVLETKNQLNYERLKKSMDCRFVLVSQCMNAAHVRKANGQYISNVAMKVNSKLGGATCRAVPYKSNITRPPYWNCPTMVIGVDVSHAAAGSRQPSMAALTMSMDKSGTRFAAGCQSNGWRKETLLRNAMGDMFTPLATQWKNSHGVSPAHIYYLRDGVSEGQFQDIIDTEIDEIKKIFKKKEWPMAKFTVIIATKRHHVRFFPKPGDRCADRNSNPLPGVLVERDVTHPQHWDWYLCSHVAIQGTARPVHYQVILDEAKVNVNKLMMMIYHQCYQYCRSTTPVSLHPAVYYAHLASNRARCHEFQPFEKKLMAYGKPGFPYAQDHSEIYKDASDEIHALCPDKMPMTCTETADLEMIRFHNTTMWYV
ncbi:Piwi-domain-containing protein [Rostrohypoxylon terebratum]|nr:Piwi-domain-containing protein [Rostrohypoxylon terebratum]